MKLTFREQMLIQRRRTGLSQVDFAKSIGLKRDEYARMERGEIKNLIPVLKIGWKDLSGGERCYVYRKRAGVTTKAIADDMGTHRVAIHKMENDLSDPTDLICYWEA